MRSDPSTPSIGRKRKSGPNSMRRWSPVSFSKPGPKQRIVAAAGAQFPLAIPLPKIPGRFHLQAAIPVEELLRGGHHRFDHSGLRTGVSEFALEQRRLRHLDCIDPQHRAARSQLRERKQGEQRFEMPKHAVFAEAPHPTGKIEPIRHRFDCTLSLQ